MVVPEESSTRLPLLSPSSFTTSSSSSSELTDSSVRRIPADRLNQFVDLTPLNHKHVYVTQEEDNKFPFFLSIYLYIYLSTYNSIFYLCISK